MSFHMGPSGAPYPLSQILSYPLASPEAPFNSSHVLSYSQVLKAIIDLFS